MLLRFSILYFIARLLPGIANFFAIVLFTRLLNPQEYGQYALVIAAVGLGNAVLFHWLRVALLRYLPAYEGREPALLSTLFVSYAALAGLSVVIGLVGGWLWSDMLWSQFFVLGVALLVCQAWFDVNLQLIRARLMPVLYGILLMSKAMIGLAVGVFLAYLGWGAWGPLIGVTLGVLLPAVVLCSRYWVGVRWQLADRQAVKELFYYGMPLAVTFGLGLVINSADRFLIGALIGTDAAGQYAVGYDFAHQAIGMLMIAVNLAAAPLVIKGLESEGEQVARQRMESNAIALCGIGFPSAVGLAMVAPNVSALFIGDEFQATAAILIPWIAVGALLAGLKAFYFDLSFQLGKRTQQQVLVVVVAGVVNLALNLWWIPLFGLLGAAYATVVAYGVALYLSWLLGRRIFPVPLPMGQIGRIVLATLGMIFVLLPVINQQGPVALLYQVVLGGVVYSLLILLMNVANCRSHARRIARRLGVGL